jgi:hypothetical protein
VNFSIIVAARPTNASKKLPARALDGLVTAARGSLSGVGERSRRRRRRPKRHFFLAMKKN